MDWQFYKNFRFAFRGLKTVFSTEKTFRLHTIIAILVVAYSWYQGIEKIYWVVILMIIALVMALEIFNSAIERLVDMLAPRTHKFAKEVKDLLAAMVLLVSLFAAAIGFIVFLA
ncbi:MAG: diacylglycerol kinase family protein [Candidatus Komeilibacteria bacterium]|jgi:undecaprenol kinase|nr:diacylglycerol kinase family protein [Candidatus Komeilibacteria bacterium]MBT4447232.1 diacylglycerol kinase family protein [Candidatus Komeilibacteria bacterium]